MNRILLTLEEGGKLLCDEHFVTYDYYHTKDYNNNVIGSMYGELFEVKGFTREEFYSLIELRIPGIIDKILKDLR